MRINPDKKTAYYADVERTYGGSINGDFVPSAAIASLACVRYVARRLGCYVRRKGTVRINGFKFQTVTLCALPKRNRLGHMLEV